jgi:hypothetical protein
MVPAALHSIAASAEFGESRRLAGSRHPSQQDPRHRDNPRGSNDDVLPCASVDQSRWASVAASEGEQPPGNAFSQTDLFVWTREGTGGGPSSLLAILDLPSYSWLSSSTRVQLPLASGLRTPALNP